MIKTVTETKICKITNQLCSFTITYKALQRNEAGDFMGYRVSELHCNNDKLRNDQNLNDCTCTEVYSEHSKHPVYN